MTMYLQCYIDRGLKLGNVVNLKCQVLNGGSFETASKTPLQRDCKYNCKCLLMQRWQCPIHKGTLNSVAWLSLNYDGKIYNLDKWLFSFEVSL